MITHESIFLEFKGKIMNDDYNFLNNERWRRIGNFYPNKSILNEDFCRIYEKSLEELEKIDSINLLIILICLNENKDLDEKLFGKCDIKLSFFIERLNFEFSINSHNVKFLLKHFGKYKGYYYFGCKFLIKKIYENGIEDYHSFVDFNSCDIIKSLLSSKLMDEGFMNYIISQMDIKKVYIYNFIEYEEFFMKLIKICNCNARNNCGLDCLIQCLFTNNTKIMNILIDNNVRLLTNPIDEFYVYVFNKKVYRDYVTLNSLLVISALENFDDFVKSNYFLLMKTCDKDAIKYILGNFEFK